MWIAGLRFIPWLLLRVARFRSRELFTLSVLVLAISVATVSYLVFWASMALGAFLAGMVVGQSKVSHQVAADALPLRDAFAVLFFVAVGMLFDLSAVIAAHWLTIGIIISGSFRGPRTSTTATPSSPRVRQRFALMRPKPLSRWPARSWRI
jgi:CPA2 family monovalent cation:H+ antiporter-2